VGDGGDGLGRVGDLAAGVDQRDRGELGVVEGVVAHGVAARLERDGLAERHDLLADEEERGGHLQAGERAHRLCRGGPRSVVEREGHVRLAAAAAVDRLALLEQPAHGRVGGTGGHRRWRDGGARIPAAVRAARAADHDHEEHDDGGGDGQRDRTAAPDRLAAGGLA